MTTKELYESLLAGKKIRREGWEKGEYIYLDKNGSLVDKDGDEITFISEIYLSNWTVYEEPKEILGKEEKEYLEAVLRPFKDMVVYITKLGNEKYEFLTISYKDKDANDREITLPYFDKSTMYKGMNLGKSYTLKELGLFDRKIF